MICKIGIMAHACSSAVGMPTQEGGASGSRDPNPNAGPPPNPNTFYPSPNNNPVTNTSITQRVYGDLDNFPIFYRFPRALLNCEEAHPMASFVTRRHDHCEACLNSATPY